MTHAFGEKIRAMMKKDLAQMQKKKLIKIPQRFLIDHKERDLPTPEVVKSTQNHFWIKADDPEIPELISDADYYYKMWNMGAWENYLFGICMSAKATLKAIETAKGENQ